VSADHARAAVADTQIVLARRDSPRRVATIAMGGVAVGVALGFVVAHLASNPAPSPAAAAPAPAAIASAPAASSPTANAAPAATQPQAVPASLTLPMASAAKPEKPAAVAADAVSRRLAAGRELLDPAAGHRHTVQLMVSDARGRAYLEQYLAEAARAVEPDKLYVVPTGSPDAPRFGVLFGSYDDKAQALAALDGLPTALRQFRPYVRPLEAVRDEARRAERR